MQRGLISKDSFRISRPGADVSSTNLGDFIAHEDFSFSQPYAFGYVDSPYKGFTGRGLKSETVTTSVQDVGSEPVINLFPVYPGGDIVTPEIVSEGSGSSETYYNIVSNLVSASYADGELTIRFVKPMDSRYSVDGCYYILSRNADPSLPAGPGNGVKRVRIDKDGIRISREGYDVDTSNIAEMLFAGGVPSARISETGLVTPSSYGSGQGYDSMARATVVFSKTYSRPPAMFIAGLTDDGGADVTCGVYVAVGGGFSRHNPYYSAVITATGFTFYAIKNGGTWTTSDSPANKLRPVPNVFRWWALENTIDL